MIESKQNPTFKRFMRIANNKERDVCILEGIHLCQEFLKHGERATLLYAVFQSSTLDTAEDKAILSLYERTHQHAILLSDSLFKQLSDTPSPQGVLFIVELQPSTIELIPSDCGIVLLDRLQDPGNLGTIIRTAAAAGIKHIALSKATVNPWSTKVLRSAQGAHFSLSIYRDCDLLDLMERLSVPVYATVLSDKAKSLYELNLEHEIAWLFGNEGQGVADTLLAEATEHVFIPQADAVESLNVAVACAVALFEQRRQQLL